MAMPDNAPMPATIVASVTKLIDYCVKLVTYRQDSKRRVFEECIQPLFDQFEIVHRGYLESAAAYGALIRSSREAFNEEHPLLRRIEDDASLTASDRMKLLSLSDTKNSS